MSVSEEGAWRAEQIREVIAAKRENVSIEDLSVASGIPYHRVFEIVRELFEEAVSDADMEH